MLEHSNRVPEVPKERHFSISILRNSVEAAPHPTYYVTRDGVMECLRHPQDGYVRIGRQQVIDSGQRPNDIVLSSNDRAISRMHCMISYLPFFEREIPESWVAFLMASHARLGRNSALQNLPSDLARYILLFLWDPPAPCLIDLGSMCGTYIKVGNQQRLELSSGEKFLVGCDILIEIERVVNEPMLCTDWPTEDMTVQEIDQDFELGPFIVIRISRYPTDHEETFQPITWKFVAENKYQKFTIGRSQLCDIHLAENTISRTQCRVVYEDGKWALFDGVENRPTVNGTWLSIGNLLPTSRTQSEPYALAPGTQIKVSDSILQIDWAS